MMFSVKIHWQGKLKQNKLIRLQQNVKLYIMKVATIKNNPIEL